MLFGEIGNREITVETVPHAQASHRVYEIQSAQGADRITKTSQFVQCARGETHYATAGVAYQLKGGEFHTTEVADNVSAATMLVAVPVAGGSDRSLGPLDLPGRADSWLVHRRSASAAVTRRAIDTILDHAEALPRGRRLSRT